MVEGRLRAARLHLDPSQDVLPNRIPALFVNLRAFVDGTVRNGTLLDRGMFYLKVSLRKGTRDRFGESGGAETWFRDWFDSFDGDGAMLQRVSELVDEFIGGAGI